MLLLSVSVACTVGVNAVKARARAVMSGFSIRDWVKMGDESSIKVSPIVKEVSHDGCLNYN